MKYIIDGNEYNVIIERKNNKNTYIRISSDLDIYVTTSYFVSKKQILKLLDSNQMKIKKMIKKREVKNEKNNSFYYLDNKYDVIYVSNFDKKITFDDDKIFVINEDYLNKWIKKQTSLIFKDRLDYIYSLFDEDIVYPKLKIRKMKTRWGVCNRKNNTVTLNSELIKYSYKEIDYVIIHELSHFIHFNHSQLFWEQVSKYCPNYKIIRKNLKEG